MASETFVADAVELVAYRGVDYYEEFTLRANDGTEAAPVLGLPEDLTDWPAPVALVDVAADQTFVRGTASMVAALTGRFALRITAPELDKAFDIQNRSRPLHVTVGVRNSANTESRVLLSGTMRVRETGF